MQVPLHMIPSLLLLQKILTMLLLIQLVDYKTQTNLSNELKRLLKFAVKAMENAPHQKLMILDGTQGNSAIAQAKAFNEMIGIDGIIVTKLDGTAKGGALFLYQIN